jgi:hypothetical protein
VVELTIHVREGSPVVERDSSRESDQGVARAYGPCRVAGCRILSPGLVVGPLGRSVKKQGMLATISADLLVLGATF